MHNFQKYYKTNYHLHLTGAFELQGLHCADKLSFFDENSWKNKKDFLSKNNNLFTAICISAQNESKNNVKYVEITINCLGLLKRGMTKESIKGHLENAHYYCKNNFNIYVAYKIGINRKDEIEKSLELLNLFKILSDSIKICIDINGNERKRPDFNFEEIFHEADLQKIKVSIHTGEFLGLNYFVNKAIECNPYRLGHVYSIIENKNQLNEIKKRNLMVELCPISTNIMNPFSSTIYKSQASLLIDKKINFVLGTDDPIFFKNSINDDLNFLKHACKLTDWEVVRIINFGLFKSRLNNKLWLILYNVILYASRKVKKFFY